MLGVEAASPGFDKSGSIEDLPSLGQSDDVDFFAGPTDDGFDAAFDNLSDHGMEPIYRTMTDTTKTDLFANQGGPEVSGNIGDAPSKTQTPKAEAGFMDHAFEGTQLGNTLTAMKTMTQMKTYVDKAKNICKLELPSFNSCMAFINPGNFGKPKGAMETMTRLKQNLQVYKPNYILGAMLLFCLTIVTSPSLLFGFLLIAAVWFFVLGREEKDGEVQMIGPIPLNRKTKFCIMAPVTFLFLMWWCASAFSWTLILSGMCSAGHAIFHKTPEHMLKRLGANEIPLYEGDAYQANADLGGMSDDFIEFNLD